MNNKKIVQGEFLDTNAIISTNSPTCEAHLSSLLESTRDFTIYRLAAIPETQMELEVVFVSPSITDLMGVTNPRDFKSWFDNIHPEDLPRVIKANHEARKTNRFDESMRVFHPIKNEWRWIHSISTGVPDENGQPIFVNGIIIDITAQKLAEGELIKMQNELESRVLARTLDLENLNKRLTDEIQERQLAEIALKESEEKYRNIVENSPDILYRLDGQGKFEAINIPGDDFYGYNHGDVLGRDFIDFIYPEDRERVTQSFMSAIESRREWTRGLQFRVMAKNGESPWLELNSHMGFDENYQYIKEEGILRDITDRKLSEDKLIRAHDELERRVQERTAELSASNKSLKQEILDRKKAEEQKQKLEGMLRRSQKLEAIGTLAGGIAHDFNNILSAVIGYAQLAEMDTPEDSENKKYLGEIVRASRRATELIRHILTFSRQFETDKRPIEIKPILKEAIKLIRATLPATIEIKEQILAPASTVLADPTQIHQVIVNLCTNAFHAMEKKGGVLTIELDEITVQTDQEAMILDVFPGNYVRLSVGDTGRGIDESIRDQVFDPYFSTKEPGEGTGLGLSTVHGIVKSCQGTVNFYSEPGQGATFNVYLPKIDQKVITRPSEAKPLKKGHERILFVDDEAAIVDSGLRMLERLGYQVKSFTCSVEALNEFRAHPDRYDLLITDFTMPQMTGIELSHAIMEIRSDLPIILCTGFSTMITQEKAKALGIREFVMKPILVDKLADTVRTVLDGK